MSLEAALADPIFQTFAVLALVALVAAGLLLAVLRWGLGKSVGHAWASYRGWLVMVPVILVCIALGRLTTIGFFTLVALAGAKELARVTGLDRDKLLTLVVYFGIALVGIACAVPDPREGVPGWYGLFMALPAFVVGLILLVPITRDQVAGQVRLLSLAIVAFIYIGWMFGHLTYLANASHAYGYLLYLLFAVELNDVAAYTFGRLFGKHKFRPNISPNKTWEGALGALAISLLLPWLFRFSLPHFTAVDLLLTGLIVGIGGQVGDLAISVLKRDLHVKDMGQLIPGHGGILDRIDSLIYVAPLFFHLVRWRYDIYL